MVSTQEYLSSLTLCSRTSKYMCSLLLNFTPSYIFSKLKQISIFIQIFYLLFNFKNIQIDKMKKTVFALLTLFLLILFSCEKDQENQSYDPIPNEGY